MDSVFEIAGILPLTPENSEIVEEGDFPVLYLLDDKGKKERLGLIEIKRAFPFEQDWNSWCSPMKKEKTAALSGI